MSEPIWSILIATLASRTEKFLALMDTLLPQVEQAPTLIEVIACHNNGDKPLGSIRQGLLMTAKGEYVSFLDDDDRIPVWFIEQMLPALEKKPDVVGFYMRYYEDGNFWANSYHSIQHEPHDGPDGYYRDVTHQQPVRTELARQGDFRLAWPEDNAWRNRVRPLLKSEVYVDQCMYYYFHNWGDTVQGNLAPHTFTPRPTIDSPAFRWLELSDID